MVRTPFERRRATWPIGHLLPLAALAVTLSCADGVAPEPGLSANQEPAVLSFDYDGAYSGSFRAKSEYRDVAELHPGVPADQWPVPWASAEFVAESQGFCAGFFCSTARWWISVEVFAPAPANRQLRILELLIPERSPGTWLGTYTYSCGQARAEFDEPGCAFAPSLRDLECTGDGMPVWCLYGDRAGRAFFELSARHSPQHGWFWDPDVLEIVEATIALDDRVAYTPPGAAPHRLRGSFSAVLRNQSGATVRIRNGRLEIPVR